MNDIVSKSKMTWYLGIVKTRLVEYKGSVLKVEAECPVDGCHGNLVATGSAWMSGPVGNHHICTECGCGKAICHQEYPLVYQQGVGNERQSSSKELSKV